LRARLDPQASKIRAHFTLVFPVDVPERRPMEDRISTAVSGHPPISFIIREARVVRDLGCRRHHVLLVPEEGRKELVALHDELYEGPLRPHLRKDIPFIPHVTVAEYGTSTPCRRLADELNRRNLAFRGLVKDVELIQVQEKTVRRIGRFDLSNDKTPGHST